MKELNGKSKLYGGLLLILVLLFASSQGFAAEVTLSWAAPTTNSDGTQLTDLAGYNVYFGNMSGNYTQSLNVGNVTSYQLAGLTEGTTYFFAVTAYDTSGNESMKSNEVQKTIEYVDTQPPVISGVSSGGITYTSVTISWTTDEPSDSQVEYGLTTDYGNSTALESAAVTSHSQTISGLLSGTKYHFRVLSRDEAGNLAVSGVNYFATEELVQISYYCDNDGDNYIDSSLDGTCTGEGCEPAGCQVTAGNDCDDGNAGINPGAEDIANDGIDQDCSGSDFVDIVAPAPPIQLTFN